MRFSPKHYKQKMKIKVFRLNPTDKIKFPSFLPLVTQLSIIFIILYIPTNMHAFSFFVVVVI